MSSIVSEMTYNVSMGTLNPTIPYHTDRVQLLQSICVIGYQYNYNNKDRYKYSYSPMKAGYQYTPKPNKAGCLV